MKLKTKLVISFCLILFVPLSLAGITIYGFNVFQTKLIEETYGLTGVEAYGLTNSIQLLNRFTRADFENLQKTALDEPEKLSEEAYLQSVDKQLKEKYSYLIVRKDEEIFYNGEKNNEEVLDSLGSFGSTDPQSAVGTYLDSADEILIKQVDFHFQDGGEGSAFIVTSTRNVVPEIKSLLINACVAIVLILLLTAIMMIAWIYRSMITPIKKLQVAAENIKEGNLDFSIDVSGEDEIAELCITFEEMRKRLKDNVEEKIVDEKESRVLISNIAHDLKTPITAVKGYSEGILDGVANTPDKVDRYVRTIYNKACEMDTLINELTIYSKIDTNRIPYNFAKINVAEYFGDCAEEIGLDLESKRIGLAYYNYVQEDVIIIADPEQLRRVINNIIGNSVKYMNKAHGFINMRIKDVGDFIQVEIEDNGRGIAQKDLPYIFDRFYRADASRNSATGGSGIGLSIVKKIMEDHGGKIWATSKEDTGTIMYFVIRKYQEVINE
ncbi:MAG: HAMP domain-containing histidine kinase [Agathobacter sp.]|nr:HAMP domain-containing histidine kinase [Agathobacter sp.]